MLKKTFFGKTVLITGHTGFKGSWLSIWLNDLGANVVGLGLDPISTPSHFQLAEITNLISDHRVDINKYVDIERIVDVIQPDFVFHLAAQALVKKSYDSPVETFSTNVMGTINVLESLRKLTKQCTAVLVTSDKCYDNLEWCWGYRETDKIGGPDPYSGSKGAAELAISSYVKSFFYGPHDNIRIGIARAGNVIGGGDWSSDRIVPDLVRARANESPLPLRNPMSTRPWQHVLEPLSGYLLLAAQLSNLKHLHGEAFNFGPNSENNHTVKDLVMSIAEYWDGISWEDISQQYEGPYESGLLKLNCDKALQKLNWKPNLNFSETVSFTAEWYKNYYIKPKESMHNFSLDQIRAYVQLAKNRKLFWTI